MNVSLDLIDGAHDNPRKRIGDIDDLASSIAAQGVLQPLVVVEQPDGRYLLIAGHRRAAAARKAGLTDVPVTLRDPMTDRERLAAMVAENIHRRTLTGRERAEAFQAMVDQGMTKTEVARAVGLHPSTIAYSLELLKPPEQRQAEHAERERRRESGEIVRGRPVEATPAELLKRLRESNETGLSCYLTPGLARIALGLIQRGARAAARERARQSGSA